MPGNPASVLYVKNLAKDVVSEDFYFIFGIFDYDIYLIEDEDIIFTCCFLFYYFWDIYIFIQVQFLGAMRLLYLD